MTFTHWNLFLAVFSATATGEFTVPGYNRCGVRGQAENHEFPWHVAIHYNGAFLCGGSILNKEWILTAAHCFDAKPAPKLNPALVEVFVGLRSLSSANSLTADDKRKGSGVFGVANIKVHSSYDKKQFANDVALVQLSNTIDFSALESANVRQVCLPSVEVDAHIQKSIGNEAESVDGSDARREACIVSGWGLAKTNKQPDLLAYTATTLVGNNCLSTDESQICAMVNNPTAGATNRGSCGGGGGDPLACKLEEQAQLVQMGVVSFGSGECGLDSPDVHARVSFYVEWIRASTKASDLAIFSGRCVVINSGLRSRPQLVIALMVFLQSLKFVVF